MKEILGQYGNTLIAVMAALALLGLLSGLPYGGKTGICGMAGQLLTEGGRHQLTGYENMAYTEYKSARKPELHFLEGYLAVAGKRIRVTEFCQAVDETGTEVPVKILSIRDSGGAECEDAVLEEGVELCFPEAGIYELWVKAEDDSGRSRFGILNIPVQSAAEGEDG